VRNDTVKVTGGVRAANAALLAALVAAVGPALAADQAPKPPAVSAALQKPLAEVQDLLKANKFPEAIDKLHAADALAGKTPYDQHTINQMTAYACSKTNDVPCVGKALQGQIDDGFTTSDENQKFTRLVAQVNFQNKDYDKAIDYGNRAIKGGFGNDDMYSVVAGAYYLKEDYKDAAQLESTHIPDLAKKGETPKQEELSLYTSACAKLKDDDCIRQALQYQVTYYPKPEAWAELIYAVRPSGDVETLQTYRLMMDVGAMKNADDYLDMASVGLGRGSPGDAQHALKMGTDAGAFTGAKAGDAQKLTAEAKKAAANDQATLPRIEQEANAAPTGAKNAGVGLAYLGYQQFDKAAEQFAKAVSKGGLKNEADSRLNLGIAQLKAGHKDDAVQTFQSVKGPPVLERLAALWVIHAKQS
jgi:tetratricopeptide (TPR) repeat protein